MGVPSEGCSSPDRSSGPGLRGSMLVVPTSDPKEGDMFDPFRRRLAAGKREGGFTLIELLLVLIILAILVTMAFPTYVGFKSRAQRRTAQANLRAAVPAVETYFADNETYAGMDLAALRLIDASVRNNGTNGVFIVSATADDYCVRSVNADFTYYKAGPAEPITTAVCA